MLDFYSILIRWCFMTILVAFFKLDFLFFRGILNNSTNYKESWLII